MASTAGSATMATAPPPLRPCQWPSVCHTRQRLRHHHHTTPLHPTSVTHAMPSFLAPSASRSSTVSPLPPASSLHAPSQPQPLRSSLPSSHRSHPLTSPTPTRRVRASANAAAAAAAASAVPSAVTGSLPLAPSAGEAAATAAATHMDLFAVLLGYACLVGSCFRSVPQILKILQTGSAEGLSLTSNLMELLCYTVTVAYNMQQGYAFNTYGEVFACWLQDVVIVGLIFRHLRLSGPMVAGATAAFAAACAWLFSSLCPIEVLGWLQMSTIAVMAVGARLPQIWLNWRRGNAGVLSVVTCCLNVAGCVVRIFTTLVLTGDVIILGGCITQLVLNAVLLWQCVATPGHVVAVASSSAAVREDGGGGGSGAVAAPLLPRPA